MSSNNLSIIEFRSLCQLFSVHDIIRAPMSRNLNSFEIPHWNQITTEHLLQKTEQVKDNEGIELTITEYATQWVWRYDYSQLELEEACEGKVYLRPE